MVGSSIGLLVGPLVGLLVGSLVGLFVFWWVDRSICRVGWFAQLWPYWLVI
jgi:hypothetical protein